MTKENALTKVDVCKMFAFTLSFWPHMPTHEKALHSWHMALTGLTRDEAAYALFVCVRQPGRKFPPTPGELREVLATECNLMTAEEAWGFVNATVRENYTNYEQAVAVLKKHPRVLRAVSAVGYHRIHAVRRPYNPHVPGPTEADVTFTRRDFVKAYDEAEKQERTLGRAILKGTPKGVHTDKALSQVAGQEGLVQAGRVLAGGRAVANKFDQLMQVGT